MALLLAAIGIYVIYTVQRTRETNAWRLGAIA
jgi:hypothetical protein